jgi:hypothetical protein
MNFSQNLTKLLSKKTIIFLSFLYPFFCFSQNVDIKLSCQISLTTRYISGTVERDLVKEIFTVYQSNNFLSIIASSDSGLFGSVTTSHHSGTISIENESNSNKWHLKVKFIGQSGKMNDYSINIDRNSGSIFYNSDFDFGKLVKQGQGQCQKIDSSKKLF